MFITPPSDPPPHSVIFVLCAGNESSKCDRQASLQEDVTEKQPERPSRAAEPLLKLLFGFLKKQKTNKRVSLYDIMHRNKDIKQFRPLH